MNPVATTRLIKQLAYEQGFGRVGVARAAELDRAEYLRQWLDRGRAGEMRYLHRHLELRCDPAQVLPGARSVIVLALNYKQPRPQPPPDRDSGRVAMYAWGEDYHDVLRAKLRVLIEALRQRVEVPFRTRACVDTAPVVERELAMRAGVGWIGKNTLVLHQDLGSYFFLGEIITTLELEPDAPAMDHCGSCTRCLDACPTEAFPAPYEMDARRCISYHTIELRSGVPREFQEAIGDWLFGCDICQEVCPFNHHAPGTTESRLAIREPGPFVALDEVLGWAPEDYGDSLRGSAMRRATLDMLQRNARIVAANLQRSAAHGVRKDRGDPAGSPRDHNQDGLEVRPEERTTDPPDDRANAGDGL